jgi:vacuolar-type H+-ATPase subunit E/Vma4
MGHEYIVERILDDAKTEARRKVAEAKKLAADNIAYAKKRNEEILTDAKKAAKMHKEREEDIAKGTQEIHEKLIALGEKTRIVDEVFEAAFKEIKFKWRVETKPKYEERLTREVLLAALREEIEAEVVGVLFK